MRICQIAIIGLAVTAFGYRKIQEIGTTYRHVI